MSRSKSSTNLFAVDTTMVNKVQQFLQLFYNSIEKKFCKILFPKLVAADALVTYSLSSSSSRKDGGLTN